MHCWASRQEPDVRIPVFFHHRNYPNSPICCHYRANCFLGRGERCPLVRVARRVVWCLLFDRDHTRVSKFRAGAYVRSPGSRPNDHFCRAGTLRHTRSRTTPYQLVKSIGNIAHSGRSDDGTGVLIQLTTIGKWQEYLSPAPQTASGSWQQKH